MKAIRMLSVLALAVSGWITSMGQVSDARVPGDNFSLEGALELFKKSASPEEFEKMLNSPDSKVNNLDLNGDGYIDYIRVHDRYEGNVHAFILQAVVSEREMQDVAVIELEKLSNGKAVLQIVGDEDIYGIETIIEPTQEVRTYAGTTTTRTVVNVWAWPSVQYVYGPYYAGWASPWGWYHRPVWWHTWRPIAYVHYHPIWRPYYSYYAPCYTRRVVYAHRIYQPYRTRSVVVRDRHHQQLARYRAERRDDYRNGRTRDDDRRAYANDTRSSRTNTTLEGRRRTETDVNRRSTLDADASRDRENSRERSPQVQRNLTEQTREQNLDRRPVTVPDNGEARRTVTAPSPTLERRRATAPATIEQRRTSDEWSARTDIQRQPAEVKRSSSMDRRAESPSIQRSTQRTSSSPAIQQRSAPRSSPSVQQRSAPRSSSPSVQRSAPSRSTQGASRTSGGSRRGLE